MKITIFTITLIFLIGFTNFTFAKDEIVLRKETMYWAVTIDDDVCYKLIDIEVGRDVPDMRDQPCSLRDGKFSFTITGPPGTTVTLFGDYNFKKGNGFLIIKKKDEKKIWLQDIIAFPPDQWFYSEANENSGAFDAFYNPSPMFEQSLYSIKWGGTNK
jgi:hypothetical protein